jgi:hypothetical protein
MGAKALSLGEKKVSDAAEGRFLAAIDPLSSSIPLRFVFKGLVVDCTSTLPYGIDKSKESRSNALAADALAAAKCSSYGRSSTSTTSFFYQRPRVPPLLLSIAKGLHENGITMMDKGRFYAGTYSFRGAIEVC